MGSRWQWRWNGRRSVLASSRVPYSCIGLWQQIALWVIDGDQRKERNEKEKVALKMEQNVGILNLGAAE